MESHRPKTMCGTNTKRRKHSTEEAMVACPSLPHDVIIDLLSWLPAKSLVRFKRVCKSWQNLITDLIKNPSFIKLHIQHASFTSDEHFTLMVNGDDEGENDSLYTVDYFHGETSGKLVKLDYPFHLSEYNSVTIVGSCNGLVCIRVEDPYCDPIICIWNPCTSEYKNLPFPNYIEGDISRGHYVQPETQMYGFGYDCKNDDYKVVCVESYCLEDDDDDVGCRYAVQVYTLRLDTWRRIEDLPYGAKPSQPWVVLVNGAIHWLVYVNIDNYNDIVGNEMPGMVLAPIYPSRSIVHKVSKMVIVALDLGDETYSEVPLPDCVNNDFEYFGVNLGALDGSLCILCNVDDTHLDVWMMKDYGEETSWIKVLTIAEDHVDSSTCRLNKRLPGHPVGEAGNRGTRLQAFSRVQTNIASPSSFQDSGGDCFILSQSPTKVFRNLDDLKLIKMVKHGDIILNDGCQSSFRLYGPSYERAKNLKISGSVEAYVGSLVSLNSGLYMERDEEEEVKDEKEEVVAVNQSTPWSVAYNISFMAATTRT